MSYVRNRNIIIFLISVILVLFLVLVMFIRQRNYLEQIVQQLDSKLPNYGEYIEFDAQREGGHLLPNLNMLVKGEKQGESVRIITNSKGFRNDREFDYDVRDKRFRILLLGDSFVDGMRTDQKNTIGYVLEKFLKANKQTGSYEDFEVMISGHNNPVNAFYYYQEHGWKYHPNLVILGITLGNDITWHNYKGSMLPIRNADGYLHLKFKVNCGPLWMCQGGINKINLLLPADAYLEKNDFREFFQNMELGIRNYLAQESYRFSYSVPPVLGPKQNVRRQVYAAGFYMSLGLFYNPVMQEIEEMYSDFEEVLMGMSHRIEKDSTKFLMVLFPVRIQVSKEDWKLLRKNYSLNEKKFDLTYPNRRIVTFCNKHGIDFLDLLPDYEQYVQKMKKPLYRARGDMHFNEMGQELAAKVIGERVIDSLISYD